jgi:hypothetical protein
MTTPTLNLNTVYTVTSSVAPSFTFTVSELLTVERLLASIYPGTELYNAGGLIVDEDGLEFAVVASPEDLAYEANKQLQRIDAQATDGIGPRDDIYAAPGTHDSTLILSDGTATIEGNAAELILSDGTATIEGNAAEIIQALEALPVLAGWQAAWAALTDFPLACDCGCCACCGECDDTDTDTAGA